MRRGSAFLAIGEGAGKWGHGAATCRERFGCRMLRVGGAGVDSPSAHHYPTPTPQDGRHLAARRF